MNLKGKLKKEFEEWVGSPDVLLQNMSLNNPTYLSDVMELLPLSMQFALLCDFLEEKGYKFVSENGVFYSVVVHSDTYKVLIVSTEETKTEAIEKAIEYLNDNY